MVPPLPYMEQVLYGPSHVSMVPPHVRYDGHPLPYMEQVSYGPPPTCTIWFFRPASKESIACPHYISIIKELAYDKYMSVEKHASNRIFY